MEAELVKIHVPLLYTRIWQLVGVLAHVYFSSLRCREKKNAWAIGNFMEKYKLVFNSLFCSCVILKFVLFSSQFR